jgi:hypothetical protein
VIAFDVRSLFRHSGEGPGFFVTPVKTGVQANNLDPFSNAMTDAVTWMPAGVYPEHGRRAGMTNSQIA